MKDVPYPFKVFAAFPSKDKLKDRWKFEGKQL